MIDSVVWAQYINVTDRQPRRYSKCRANALRRAAKTMTMNRHEWNEVNGIRLCQLELGIIDSIGRIEFTLSSIRLYGFSCNSLDTMTKDVKTKTLKIRPCLEKNHIPANKAQN